MNDLSEELESGAASEWYIPILGCTKRYLLCFGGRSSAKTHTIAQKMASMCREEKNFRGVLIRQVYNTIRDSSFSKIESVIEDFGWQDEFNITYSPLKIVHKKTGNQIIARGLDKAEKLKSLDDPTVIWIEEAIEVDEDSFVKVDTSIRSSKPDTLKQMILSFNPEDEAHWINDRFFPPKGSYETEDGSHTFIQSPEPDTCILHTNYLHNNYLCDDDKKTITRLERAYGKDSNYYKVYVLGLWGNALKGLVFENYKIASAFPAREDCKLYGTGLDFGFTNHPSALIRCALAHGELWFQELFYERGLVNTGEYSICEKLENLNVSKKTKICADEAEPKSITEIRGQGYDIVGVKKGKDSIEAGLKLVKQYPINLVCSERFPSINLKKEFRSYRYKEADKDSEQEFSNKPVDAWNHGIDGLRYWTWYNLAGTKLSEKGPKVHVF